VRHDAKFCANCATPISQAAPWGGYGAAARGGRNMTPIIIGAIVLTLLIGGGLAAFFLLGGGSDSPADVVKKAIRATERGNSQELISYLAKKERDAINARMNDQTGAGRKAFEDQMAKGASEAKQKGGLSSVDIKSEKIEGDKATVEFVVKMGNGETTPGKINLVKEDGAWKAQITSL
jgi:hypothetical protein